ncbi:MAG TPA: peptide ABC transporter substrate-binding protein [Pyrinomonadaceae bacterium]|jgi:ABC-type oligopeptide transport system substrate-binding subunit
MNLSRHKRLSFARLRVALSMALVLSLLTSGCFESERGEPFYGRIVVPHAQEFRWSDGGLPRVFDPALAAAPPDTDAVRAMFEGLTDYDPRSLTPVSAVATRWESSPDGRRWTFYLRRDARWSNGDAVTAKDFVRSWQRTLRLGDRAPHARLLENIEGAENAVALVTDPSQPLSTPVAESDAPAQATRQQNAPEAAVSSSQERATPSPSAKPPVFGARAVDDFVLAVRLRRPDKNFPALVAHPVFRPVYEPDAESESADAPEVTRKDTDAATQTVVSNGAFRLSTRADDSVLLERASNYWDASKVALERVRFVAGNAESALATYRNGDVDAVTNAPFEPLALKLLTPYEDFRRGTYGALTYYSFNLKRAPFNDRRVRKALAIALDRERLSMDTMKGATEPAKKFLPDLAAQEEDAKTHSGDADSTNESDSSEKKDATEKTDTPETNGESDTTGEAVTRDNAAADETDAPEDETALTRKVEDGGESESTEHAAPLEQDVERARRLLAEAGFADGVGFPRIRLLVNRNDQHRIMAQAVAAMWRNVLGVETEIVQRDWEDYEAALWTGDYDIARRSMVMQTTDEESNMLAIFARETEAQAAAAASAQPDATPNTDALPTPSTDETGDGASGAHASSAEQLPTPILILTEAQALSELPAFPVYFASSYALVKPYVVGFDTNLLDAPSLKHVRINREWKPPQEKELIRIVRNE